MSFTITALNTELPKSLPNDMKVWVSQSEPGKLQLTYLMITPSTETKNTHVQKIKLANISNESTDKKAHPLVRKPGDRMRAKIAKDPSYALKMKTARQHIAEAFFGQSAMTLRKFRLLTGLSQEDVAKHTGTTQPHYSKIENGEIFPKDELASKIAQALNISIQSFRELTDSQSNTKDCAK